MAKLKVLGSSSSGNSYILECGDEILLIELGVKIDKVLNAINYEWRKVVGVLCSHRHSDHSRYINEAIKRGVNVYSCADVQEYCNSAKTLTTGKKTRLGGFLIQPIPLYHNVECIGFLIEHPNMGKMVFCTDTCDIPYVFKNVNHFVVEANYDTNIVIDNICNAEEERSQSENHMLIDDTITFLQNNLTGALRTITLIHLSDENSDEKKFVERVSEELSFPYVCAAKTGVEVDVTINKY